MERGLAYQRESPKIANTPGAQAVANDATLTAASLIDAIITHQINQTSNPNSDTGPPGGNNPKSAMVDNLFNRYRKTGSPVDSRDLGRSERHKEQRHEDPTPPSAPQRPPSSSPSVPSTTKAAFTLGEHIESIIAKDFHQSIGSSGEDWERDWQRRQARLSAAANEALINDYSKRNAAAMEYAAKMREGAVPDYGHREPDNRQPGISPLDYVNKKIVEVMRTSSDGAPEQPNSPAPRRGPSPAPSPNKRSRMNEEERGGPSPMVSHFLSAYPSMPFPYSMPPNVPMSSASGTPTTSSSNQPHVVMAPQYEPLSEDED